MLPNLLGARNDTTCAAGTQWYTCDASNGNFTGCCSIDACANKGCSDSSTSSASITATLVLTEIIPTQTSQTSQATTIIAPSSSPSTIGTALPLSTALAMTGATATSAAASKSATPMLVTNYTPIIVGITVAMVASLLLSLLAWFLIRRRKQTVRLSSNSGSTFGGKEGKEYRKARQNSYEGAHLQASDGLGCYNPPVHQNRARSLSNQSMDLGCRGESHEEEGHLIPLPLAARNPSYHASSSRSPEIPEWQPIVTPGTPTSPNAPIAPMPSTHFKPGKSPSPSGRARSPSLRALPHASPEAQPPLWKHPAFRPDAGKAEPVLLDSTPVVPTNELDGFSFFSRTNTPTQQVKGHHTLPSTSTVASELPAEVPLQPPTYPKSPTLSLNSPTLPPTHWQDSLLRSTRPATATYTATPTQNHSPIYLTTPTPIPHSKTDSTPPSPVIIMKSNMNEREDHVMSWSSYSASNLSGIGGSGSGTSTPTISGHVARESERARRQREIEQGVRAREKEARKVVGGSEGGKPWSETPETPLSGLSRESWTESWAMR